MPTGLRSPFAFFGRNRLLVAVIVSMAIVNLVYGIAFPLFALVLDAQGASKTLIGLSTLTQAVAVFAIAPAAPALLERIPPARIMQGASVLLAVLFLTAGLIPNVYAWFPLRFLMGCLSALLWITSEALINELASDERRGRIIGVYTSVGAAGFALGPLLLALTGSEGLLPFASTALMIFLAAGPLALASGRSGPEGAMRLESQAADQGGGLWAIFFAAPVIMLANVAYAAVAESMITFFPIFGMHVGLEQTHALWLMTITAIGSMICVLPLGWLADHVDRLGLMIACVLLTMAGFALMPMVLDAAGGAMAAYMFLFGGVEGMIYPLAVILMGQHYRGMALARASSVFTACWGAGTVIGPFLTGVGMDRLGAEWMVAVLIVFLALYLPFPVRARMTASRAP
jgi:MFS family permease